MSEQHCHGCCWKVEGGYDACRSRFYEALARDFSDARYFGTHRLMVDIYCLQHPDEFCASAKSLAAHLVGLCWVVEEGASASIGPEQLRQWLDGDAQLTKPTLPVARGHLTIGDMPQHDDPTAWADAVRIWAQETWAAYAPLHPLAREWLARARG